MPYLAISTNEEIPRAKKDTLKSALGNLIPIIPGKSEPDLMLEFRDGASMFMGGAAAPCAYVDLRVYTKTDDGAKKHFTSEVLSLLERELKIKTENLYMTIAEFDNWGYDGEFH